jgi:hypothetical protein
VTASIFGQAVVGVPFNRWDDQGKLREARELLAPVHGWFTEGFDTRDLKEAKALLTSWPRTLTTRPVTYLKTISCRNTNGPSILCTSSATTSRSGTWAMVIVAMLPSAVAADPNATVDSFFR